MSDGARHGLGRRSQDQVDLVVENQGLRVTIVELEAVVRLEQALRIKAESALNSLRAQIASTVDDFLEQTGAYHG